MKNFYNHNYLQYKQLDDEHVGLFEAMFDVEQHPADQGKVDLLQKLLRDHFYYEESRFKRNMSCSVNGLKQCRFQLISHQLSGLKTGLYNTSRTLTLPTRDI